MGGHGHGEPEPVDDRVYPKASWLQRRVHGWTFQAYPVGMGISAVYVSMNGLKNHPDALTSVEIALFFFNIFVFSLNTFMMAMQAILWPQRTKSLIKDPVKGIFVPMVVLSFATIIIGVVLYSIPLSHVSPEFVFVVFWIYVAFALIVCFPMLMIWFNKPHNISTYTPAWMFLVFPLMLTGIVGSQALDVFPHEDPRCVSILLVSYVFQGAGLTITMLYLSLYLLRIVTTGFLDGHQANGAFVAAGPPGFTATALLKLGQSAMDILPRYNLVSPQAGEIWYAGSVLSALLLYGMAIFLFIFGALPYFFKVHKHLNEILGAAALTFPNVGWIGATKLLGDVFNSQFLFTIHAVMVVVIAFLFTAFFILLLVAFFKGLILISTDKEVWMDSPAGIREAAEAMAYPAGASPGSAASKPGYMSGRQVDDLPMQTDEKDDKPSPPPPPPAGEWRPYRFV